MAAERFLRPLADGAVAVLLAPSCAACRQPLDQPTRGAVCPACWAAIVPITPPCCRTCGDPLPTWRARSVEETLCPRCRRSQPLVSLARAIGPYEGSLRAIVHALKYDGRPTIARHLAARMREAGAGVLAGADLVVAVPLHRSRERARGFNQAREIGRHLGLPIADALTRTRRTPSQADLPAATFAEEADRQLVRLDRADPQLERPVQPGQERHDQDRRDETRGTGPQGTWRAHHFQYSRSTDQSGWRAKYSDGRVPS